MSAEILVPTSIEVGAGPRVLSPSGVRSGLPSSRRLLSPNDILFQTGDKRTCLYLVESGAVALYQQQWNGHRTSIDFAFPGDLVGLGLLDTHACCARAFGDARVTCLPLTAQSRLIDGNPELQLKLADAIEREFEYRRATLAAAGQLSPLQRIAAFLVSLSRANAHEGRDPSVVDDSLSCGFVVGLLGLELETLGAILVELEKRGLIEPCRPVGLRLKDIDALEAIAARSASNPAATIR